MSHRILVISFVGLKNHKNFCSRWINLKVQSYTCLSVLNFLKAKCIYMRLITLFNFCACKMRLARLLHQNFGQYIFWQVARAEVVLFFSRAGKGARARVTHVCPFSLSGYKNSKFYIWRNFYSHKRLPRQ